MEHSQALSLLLFLIAVVVMKAFVDGDTDSDLCDGSSSGSKPRNHGIICVKGQTKQDQYFAGIFSIPFRRGKAGVISALSLAFLTTQMEKVSSFGTSVQLSLPSPLLHRSLF